MSERTMSPTAAQAHARRIVRRRYKALREGKRVDSPHILAGRLVVLLEDAAKDSAGRWSEEWAEYVLHHAGQQYERLCEVAPIREQVSA